MPQLYITQAKPNPRGKDRSVGNIPNLQLAAEWIDFKNDHTTSLSLNRVVLQHIAYTLSSPMGTWQTAYDFRGEGLSLVPGRVVRVHSGGVVSTTSLFPEDVSGADQHVFTGKGYIWNNRSSDSARLIVVYDDGSFDVIDQAGYSAYPVEGTILHRFGNQLR